MRLYILWNSNAVLKKSKWTLVWYQYILSKVQNQNIISIIMYLSIWDVPFYSTQDESPNFCQDIKWTFYSADTENPCAFKMMSCTFYSVKKGTQNRENGATRTYCISKKKIRWITIIFQFCYSNFVGSFARNKISRAYKKEKILKHLNVQGRF